MPEIVIEITAPGKHRSCPAKLKDPLIYYFDMLGERFAMRQARALMTFALVKPSDLTGGASARSCNHILEDRLTC